MDMYLGKRCRFADDCSIFKGDTRLDIPLALHRNVFCNRGQKGWKNCERYAALATANEITSK
jgi:hypothetical protein